MSVKISVYSDYVCPYCFLAEFPLQQAAESRDVEIEWMPFELRPAPAETLRPEGEYLQRVWTESVYPLARQLNVPIVLPKVSPQPHTHLAFEGYQFAKQQGRAIQYNARVLRAFFQEEQNIGEIDVLTGLADDVGLEAADFKRALEERCYRQVHQKALQHAIYEMQISSVPTFIIGEHVIPGIVGQELLERAIDMTARDQANQ